MLSDTEEFEQALREDRQLRSRFPVVRLDRWTPGPDLAAFLKGYERACPLRLASRLSDVRFMQSLLKETKGITDTIIRCLQAAALVATREGTERIAAEMLIWWRDPPLLAHYDNPDSSYVPLRECLSIAEGRLSTGSIDLRSGLLLSADGSPLAG